VISSVDRSVARDRVRVIMGHLFVEIRETPWVRMPEGPWAALPAGSLA